MSTTTSFIIAILVLTIFGSFALLLSVCIFKFIRDGHVPKGRNYPGQIIERKKDPSNYWLSIIVLAFLVFMIGDFMREIAEGIF